MGANIFGQWSLLLAVTSWITILGSAFNSDIIRKSAQNTNFAKNNLISLTICFILLSFLIAGGGLFFNLFINSRVGFLVPGIIVAISFIFSATSSIPVAIFTSRDKMMWQYVSSINSVLIFIGLIWISQNGLSLSNVANLYLTISLIILFPVVFTSFRIIKPHFIWLNWPFFRSFLKDVAELFMTNWMLNLHITLELFLLQFFLSSKEVGIYNSALKLVVVLRLIPQTFLLSVIPETSRRFAVSDFAFGKNILNIFNKSFVFVAGILTISILALSEPIIKIMYTSEYGKATAVLKFLSFSIIPIFLQLLLLSLLFAAGKYRECNIGLAIGLIVQTLIGFALINNFGPLGASVAFFCSEITIVIMFIHFVKKFIELPPLVNIRKMLIATIIAICVTLVGVTIQVQYFLVLGSAILIYFSALYFLKGISLAEVKNIKILFISLNKS